MTLPMAVETPFYAFAFLFSWALPSLHNSLLQRGPTTAHRLTEYLANELALALLQLGSTPTSVPEQGNSFLHIAAADDAVFAASRPSQYASRCEKLQSVPQTDVHTLVGKLFERLRA
jgi:hypothetical protein